MASIASDDFAAICLLAADCDINSSLLDVTLYVEDYQEHADRHFGISRSDFRNGIFWLLYEYGHGIQHDDESILSAQTLHNWIGPILSYKTFYCNDESEHWLGTPDLASSTHLLQDFFNHHPTAKPVDVMLFLHKIGKTRRLFVTCSREGKSS